MLSKDDEKLIDKAVAFHHKHTPSWTSNVAVTVVGGLKDINSIQDTVCYNIVRGAHRAVSNAPKLLVCGIQNKDIWQKYSKELRGMFLDYLMNRSPYAKAFKIKDPNFCFKHRVIVMDTKAPANIMVGGMIAARRLNQNPGSVVMFAALVREGVSEDMAFLGSSCLSFSSTTGRRSRYCDKEYDYPSSGSSKSRHLVTLVSSGMGDPALQAQNFDLKSVKNFLTHSPTFIRPPFIENNNYYGLQITFLNKRPSSRTYESYATCSREAQDFGNKLSKRDSFFLSVSSKYVYGEIESEGKVTFKKVCAKLNENRGSNKDPVGLCAHKLAAILIELEKKVMKL